MAHSHFRRKRLDFHRLGYDRSDKDRSFHTSESANIGQKCRFHCCKDKNRKSACKCSGIPAAPHSSSRHPSGKSVITLDKSDKCLGHSYPDNYLRVQGRRTTTKI